MLFCALVHTTRLFIPVLAVSSAVGTIHIIDVLVECYVVLVPALVTKWSVFPMVHFYESRRSEPLVFPARLREDAR